MTADTRHFGHTNPSFVDSSCKRFQVRIVREISDQDTGLSIVYVAGYFWLHVRLSLYLLAAKQLVERKICSGRKESHCLCVQVRKVELYDDIIFGKARKTLPALLSEPDADWYFDNCSFDL